MREGGPTTRHRKRAHIINVPNAGPELRSAGNLVDSAMKKAMHNKKTSFTPANHKLTGRHDTTSSSSTMAGRMGEVRGQQISPRQFDLRSLPIV
jgi:hypothetical protein